MVEIELFSYKDGDTLLHKTHPTFKIILVGITAFGLLYGNLFQLCYYLVLINFAIYYCGLKSQYRELKYIIFLIFSLLLFQFFFAGDFTTKSLINILIYVLRITGIILSGALFTGTTRPDDISTGIYFLVRNKRLAESISLTIRLIPTFIIGCREIEESLNSRGLYLRKNFFFKLKYLAIPLIIEVFRQADRVSVAMESRAYSGYISTSIINKKVDFKLLIIILLPIIGMFLLN